MNYEVIALTAKITQIDNDIFIKIDLSLVFATRFIHDLINNTVRVKFVPGIVFLVKMPEIFLEQNLQ